MEIKTAEQYVVAELLETKEEINELKKQLTCREFDYSIMQKNYLTLMDLIHKHIFIRKSSAGDDYITFENSVWKTYDEAEYDKWTSIFPDLFDSNDENESEE